MSNVKSGATSGTITPIFSMAFVKSLFTKEAPAEVPVETPVAAQEPGVATTEEAPVKQDTFSAVVMGLTAYGLQSDMSIVTATVEKVELRVAATGESVVMATTLCCAEVAMERLPKDSTMYEAAAIILDFPIEKEAAPENKETKPKKKTTPKRGTSAKRQEQ